jgi:hypothetical protein
MMIYEQHTFTSHSGDDFGTSPVKALTKVAGLHGLGNQQLPLNLWNSSREMFHMVSWGFNPQRYPPQLK